MPTFFAATCWGALLVAGRATPTASSRDHVA